MSDNISRQAAIDALRVAYWDDNIQSAKDDPCIVDAMTDWAIRQVKALPSTDRTGHWVEDEYGISHCSECGAINNTVYRNFCPECGADMRGADDESTI